MVCDRHYVRACWKCPHTMHVPLPKLRKRIIYLDQFVISNVMKELDPDTPAHSKGIKGGFYRTVFERLDRLSKLQLIVCPSSPLHDNESLVDDRYEKMRAVLRQLSLGVSLVPPERFFHSQSLGAFRSWVGLQEDPIPDDRRGAFHGDPDRWADRLQISANFKLPGIDEALRLTSRKRSQYIHDVCLRWQSAATFDFRQVFEEELLGILRTPITEYLNFAQRMARATTGDVPADLGELYPPNSTGMIDVMLSQLRTETKSPDECYARLEGFLQSDVAKSIPYARITALFWTTIAREIRSGRKSANFPGASMVNDIDMVAAYSGICDAMFVDKQVSHLASQGELKEELSGRARLYSLRVDEESDFLAYLDSIEREASADHKRTVADVYGPEWSKPYLELLVRRP